MSANRMKYLWPLQNLGSQKRISYVQQLMFQYFVLRGNDQIFNKHPSFEHNLVCSKVSNYQKDFGNYS